MRLRAGIALGGVIFGTTLFLACFPDYYFFDRAGADGGEEASVRDAERDTASSMDATDVFHDMDAFDALDAIDEPDADPPDADPPDGG